MAALDEAAAGSDALAADDPTNSAENAPTAAADSAAAPAKLAAVAPTDSSLGIGVGKINDIFSAAKHLAAMKPLPIGEASALDDITDAEADELEAHKLGQQRQQDAASSTNSPETALTRASDVTDNNNTANNDFGNEEKLTRAEIALREAQRNFQQYINRLDNNQNNPAGRGPVSFLSQLRFEVEDEFTFFSDSENENDDDAGIFAAAGDEEEDEKQHAKTKQKPAKAADDDELPSTTQHGTSDEASSEQTSSSNSKQPISAAMLTEVRDFRRQLKQALKAPGEHEMLKVFAQLDFNDLKRQQAIRLRDQASQYRLRRVFAEDAAWTLNNVKTLTSTCLEALANKFADEPDLYRALSWSDQQQLLRLIPNAENLPLATTFRFVDDESYWRESCTARWQRNQVYKQSDQFETWKRMYAELNLRDRVERYVPGLASAASDAALHADILATRGHIKRLVVRQMMPPIRPAFGEVADRLATQIMRRVAIKPNSTNVGSDSTTTTTTANNNRVQMMDADAAPSGRATINAARSTVAESDDLVAEIDRLTGMDRFNTDNSSNKRSVKYGAPKNPFLYQTDSKSFKGVPPNLPALPGEELPLATRIGLVSLKPDAYLKLPRFKEEKKPQQILYQQLIQRFRMDNEKLMSTSPSPALGGAPNSTADTTTKSPPSAKPVASSKTTSIAANDGDSNDDAHDSVTRDHFDLNRVLPYLTKLRELELTYSVRQCGMNFEWRFLRATLGDCMKLGAAIMRIQLKRLCLHKSRLDDEKAGILFQALAKHPTLQVLELPNNCISDGACQTALKHLVQLKTLRKLDLSNNSIRKSGGRALAAFIAKTRQTFRSLLLASNSVGDEGACTIFDIIVKKDTSLRELDLTGNGLHDASMGALAQVLSQNRKLEVLRVSANSFREDSSAKLLQEGLSRNKTILVLDVRGCDLSVELQAYVEELTSRNRDFRRQMIVSNFIGQSTAEQLQQEQQQQRSPNTNTADDAMPRLPTELDNDFQVTFHHAYPPIQNAEQIAAALAAAETLASKNAAAAAEKLLQQQQTPSAAAAESQKQAEITLQQQQQKPPAMTIKQRTNESARETPISVAESKSRSTTKSASDTSGRKMASRKGGKK